MSGNNQNKLRTVKNYNLTKQKKDIKQTYVPNIKDTTVKELFTQHDIDYWFNINHIYTNIDKQTSLDSLLNGLNSKIC